LRAEGRQLDEATTTTTATTTRILATVALLLSLLLLFLFIYELLAFMPVTTSRMSSECFWLSLCFVIELSL